MDRDQFLAAWSVSIDRLYLVLFQVNGPKIEDSALQPDAKERSRLLELQAAAGSDKHKVQDRRKVQAIECDSSDADSAMSEEDESICRAGDRVLELVRLEVDAVIARRVLRDGERLICLLCPFRSFHNSNPQRLYKHVQRYHSRQKQHCASGTKQIKLVISIFDDDRLLGREERPNLLRRSAGLIRESVTPPLDHGTNEIDRCLRLVFTSTGPEYWNLATVQKLPLRRVRNIYYTRDFAQLLFQQPDRSNACNFTFYIF